MRAGLELVVPVGVKFLQGMCQDRVWLLAFVFLGHFDQLMLPGSLSLFRNMFQTANHLKNRI